MRIPIGSTVKKEQAIHAGFIRWCLSDPYADSQGTSESAIVGGEIFFMLQKNSGGRSLTESEVARGATQEGLVYQLQCHFY